MDFNTILGMPFPDIEEVDAFTQLIGTVDTSKMLPLDQLMFIAIYTKFMNEIKPIYLKYAAKGTDVERFEIRIEKEEL